MDDTQRQQSLDNKQQQLQQQKAASPAQETSSARDLGTAGGGSIPNLPDIDRDKTAHEARTNDSPQRSDATVERENADTPHDAPPTNDARAVNRHSQGNAATRDPGQPQTAMGDQDRTFGGRGADANEETIDPMTSRAPDKVNAPPKE